MTTVTAPRRRVAAALAAVLVAATPLLSGCFSGLDATTTYQSQVPSGDGQYVTLGDLSLQNLTIVKLDGPDALLIGTVFNNGTEPDTLLSVRVDGVAADIPDLTATIAPQSYNSWGYGSVDGGANVVTAPAFYDGAFEGLAGTYVPVSMEFERNGLVELDALVVPPTGYFAELIAPVG